MSPSVYRLGDDGAAVREIRSRLHRLGFIQEQTSEESFDGSLDSAVRAFQQQRGLIVDGVVGRNTYRVLDEARWQLGDRLLVHSPASQLIGDDVVDLQRRLQSFGVGPVDGIFGERTEAALREFQRSVGLPPDGTCGPATFKALAKQDPKIASDGEVLPGSERMRRRPARPAAKIVVIDPGHGEIGVGRNGGEFGEADLTFDLARRIEGRLGATGAQAFLTRSRAGASIDQVARAEFANRTDANLCVSVNVEASQNSAANGVATFFYGSDTHGVHSEVGEKFAGLVHREIVARTDLTDCRVHAKTWDLLRWTHMPTVLVTTGYATNPRDAARLADAAFRDVIADAIVVAIRRVYLPPELDEQTGVMRLDGLADRDVAG